MSITEHTPTPWQIHDVYRDTIVTADDLEIAACENNHMKKDSGKLDFANAAFIVRACNSHDALVKALTELYAVVKGESPSLLNEDSGGDARLDAEILAALAAAGAPHER